MIQRAKVHFLGVTLAVLLSSAFAADKAQAESFCAPGPGDRPEPGLQGGVLLSERQPPDGFQGHWCGARKVGQHALYNRGSFGDLQVIVDHRGHCAYASMRDPSVLDHPTTGTVVLDVSVASQPRDVAILRTPAMLRAYSAFEIPVSKATRRPGNIMGAAFKDFGPDRANPTNPLDLYDVSGNCLKPVLLTPPTGFSLASGNHDGWFTADGSTYYGVPFGARQGDDPDIRTNPNRIDLHVTDISNPRQPQRLLNWNRLQLPPDIYERTKDTRNFHDVTSNDEGTRLYLALYGGDDPGRCANGLLILDSSDVAHRLPNPQLRFVSWLSWCDQQIDPDFEDGSSASAHATEYVIHENGKEYIVSTDEGSALNGSANGMCDQKTYSRFIDISDERNPRVVSTFKPDVNKPENCVRNPPGGGTTGGMVHYVNFDDRYNMRLAVYAASNQGIRVVDFRDPEHPKEIAYYLKERHVAANAAPAVLFPNFTTGSTAVTGTDFTRPDPRYDLENCFWYTGWNQGGLVSIELTDPEYNPCMRRDTSGGGWLASSGGQKTSFEFAAGRADGGFGALGGTLELNDRAAGARIVINQLTSLGSMRDPCGNVSARENTVQFEGTGTYNGANASFRVCVQDNGEGKKAAGPDRFHVVCTAGCSYSAGGTLGGGNIQVRQR